MSSLAPLPSIGRKCARSRTSRLHWCKILPTKPSLRSRIHGCSTNYANPFSSRPQPLTCSGSSAHHPAISDQSLTRCWQTQYGFVRPGVLFRCQGAEFYPAAWAGVPPEYEKFLRRRGQFRPTDGAPLDRLLKTKQLVFTVDELAERHPGPAAEFSGARSLIAVPMFKDGELVGAIVIYRQEVRPFTDRQVALVSNFASQAVIAIENTRLLNELRQRTDDLSESPERQTATAEILSSISNSMTETKPVFNAIVRNLLRLFGTRFATVQVLREGIVEMPAAGGQPGFEKITERYPRPLDDTTVSGQAMLSKEVVQY